MSNLNQLNILEFISYNKQRKFPISIKFGNCYLAEFIFSLEVDKSMKKPRTKPYSMLDLMRQAGNRTPMGRPVIMLSRKDKLNKRCNAKQQWRKELMYGD